MNENLSVSALDAPVAPPGFEVSIHYDTTKTLNPLGVYLCAIDLTYHLALTEWHEQIAGAVTMGVDGFDIQIDVESSSALLQLETSHAITALYIVVVDIAALSRFCETLATISLHQRQIATLVIETRRPRMLNTGGINATNATLLTVTPQSNTVTYPTGRYIEPREPEFSVSYTYSGARINSRSIFLTVLDAFTIAAQVSELTAFESLHAMSPSGDCVMNIVGVEGEFQANYSYIINALRIVVREIMFRLNRFGEITIELEWQNSLIAEGSIKLAGRGTIEQQK